MKPIFAAAPSASARLALVVIISVALMVADHRFDRVQGLRRAIAVVLTPVQYLVDAPSRLWRWAAESLAERDRLLTENADLREQQLLLRAQTQRLSALESENQRLRELLNSSIEVGDEVLIAELVSVDLNPYSHKILLNRGSFDDVYTGQPVVDARGVVGQVTEVTPLTATVLLITDAQHAIPVQVDRTGLRTIAVGTGRSGVICVPMCTILHTDTKARPRDGGMRRGRGEHAAGVGRGGAAGAGEAAGAGAAHPA